MKKTITGKLLVDKAFDQGQATLATNIITMLKQHRKFALNDIVDLCNKILKENEKKQKKD